tara:strand:- start:328 stop:918 length:591 start_codon:yes stop_codon:yes gene_type:complete
MLVRQNSVAMWTSREMTTERSRSAGDTTARCGGGGGGGAENEANKWRIVGCRNSTVTRRAAAGMGALDEPLNEEEMRAILAQTDAGFSGRAFSDSDEYDEDVEDDEDDEEDGVPPEVAAMRSCCPGMASSGHGSKSPDWRRQLYGPETTPVASTPVKEGPVKPALKGRRGSTDRGKAAPNGGKAAANGGKDATFLL